jgi:uncharacterized membrane protein (UPF0127 family)
MEYSGFNVKIKKADNFWRRFFGFMGKRPGDYCIFFSNCTSVHSLFMRFALDVLFLDSNYNIVSIKRNVKPWRLVFGVKGAVHILEAPAGLIKNYPPSMAEYLVERL